VPEHSTGADVLSRLAAAVTQLRWLLGVKAYDASLLAHRDHVVAAPTRQDPAWAWRGSWHVLAASRAAAGL
jgi:hypothetical protein